jgi:hypothetical protein
VTETYGHSCFPISVEVGWGVPHDVGTHIAELERAYEGHYYMDMTLYIIGALFYFHSVVVSMNEINILYAKNHKKICYALEDQYLTLLRTSIVPRQFGQEEFFD